MDLFHPKMAISLGALVKHGLSSPQNGHFARGVRRFWPLLRPKMTISLGALVVSGLFILENGHFARGVRPNGPFSLYEHIIVLLYYYTCLYFTV